MTIHRACVILAGLLVLSAPARAETGDPGGAVEEVDGPTPKVIGSGQGAGGMHAFLAVTPHPRPDRG